MTDDNFINDNDLWQKEIKDTRKMKSIKVKNETARISFQINNQITNRIILNKKYEDISINDRHNVNNSTWRKINRGQYGINSKIDLHGLSEAQAFINLKDFIINGYNHDQRLLLIIVGKGNKSKNKEGVLRNMLPKWINLPDIRPYILYIREANVKDGGSGAYYMMLRKK